MKKPVPLPNVTVPTGHSPFMPVVFVQQTPADLGNLTPGTPTPYSGPREDGCHAYTNYDAVTPIRYNGQNQTSTINQTFKP
jgi:uncharacterized membrane protein